MHAGPLAVVLAAAVVLVATVLNALASSVHPNPWNVKAAHRARPGAVNMSGQRCVAAKKGMRSPYVTVRYRTVLSETNVGTTGHRNGNGLIGVSLGLSIFD